MYFDSIDTQYFRNNRIHCVQLDDTILKKIEVSNAPQLAASRKIIERLRKRDLYRYCASYVKPKDCPKKSEKVTPAQIAAVRLDRVWLTDQRGGG